MTRFCVAFIASVLASSQGFSQSVLERSPNIQGVWSAPRGEAVFVFSHRFEVLNGGDELFSVPTLTLAAGLPLGLTAGVDFTSFSEVIPDALTGNETQFWLKRGFVLPGRLQGALLGGYNTAAESAEGAVDLRFAPAPRFDLYAEGRAHSSLYGSGDGALSGAVGAAVHLTRYLAITGDVGRVLTEESVPAAWSAAVAMAIPGSPHTMSFNLANSGATTLQGASREKTVGTKDLRYGFTFTVPLGNGARWTRIFRPSAVPPPPAASVVRVEMKGFAFAPREIRVRVGQTVEWVNLDTVDHTVRAEDRSWESGRMENGAVYSRTFTTAGRYSYFCEPHPEMIGVIIVG